MKETLSPDDPRDRPRNPIENYPRRLPRSLQRYSDTAEDLGRFLGPGSIPRTRVFTDPDPSRTPGTRDGPEPLT